MGLLSWARAPLQSSPSSQRPSCPSCLSTQRQQPSASHKVCSPSAYPRTQQRHLEQGLPHLVHLRPQVFSTSRRFDPPCACWPCFMPDPLMGLHPSELCSSRAAVHRLRRLSPLDVGKPAPTIATSHAETHAKLRFPPGSLEFRGLLHAKVRHCRPDGLGLYAARGSHGLSTLQGFLPTCGDTAFTVSPLMSFALCIRERTPSAALQGLDHKQIGSSPKRPPTLLGFIAF